MVVIARAKRREVVTEVDSPRKKIKKGIDKPYKVCYTIIVKRETERHSVAEPLEKAHRTRLKSLIGVISLLTPSLKSVIMRV